MLVCEVMTANYLLVFAIDPPYEDASNRNLIIFHSLLSLLKSQLHPVFHFFFAQLYSFPLFFLHLSLLLSYAMQKKSSIHSIYDHSSSLMDSSISADLDFSISFADSLPLLLLRLGTSTRLDSPSSSSYSSAIFKNWSSFSSSQ